MYNDRLSGDRLQKFIEDTLFGAIDNIFRESMDYLDYDQIANLINNAVDHSLVMMYEDYYEEG